MDRLELKEIIHKAKDDAERDYFKRIDSPIEIKVCYTLLNYIYNAL